MHVNIKRLMGWLVRALPVSPPQGQAIALERWRRDLEEYREYQLCG
jgi:hypothetical protein